MIIAALFLLSAATQGPTGIDVADLGGGCGWPGTTTLSVAYTAGGAGGASSIVLCSDYFSFTGEFGPSHENLGSVFVIGTSTASIDLSPLAGCDLLVSPQILVGIQPGTSTHCDGSNCTEGVGVGGPTMACGTSASFWIPCAPSFVGFSVFAQCATLYFTSAYGPGPPSVELTNAVAITLV